MSFNSHSFFLILFATFIMASVVTLNLNTITNETNNIESEITIRPNCTWMQKQFCECSSFSSCYCIVRYGCYKNNNTVVIS